MRQVVRRSSFLLLVVLTTIGFLGLINDFLLALFWAVVLSVIFRNTYRRIRIFLRGRDSLAALLTTIFILLVVVIPALLITMALVNESIHFYQRIDAGELKVGDIVSSIEQQIPLAEEFLARFGIEIEGLQENFHNAVLSFTQAIANRALSFTQNALVFTVQFFLMLYLLFFFLRDGERLTRKVINVLPLGNRRERMLLSRFASVSRATLKGSLIVAVIQGTLGGLLFWAVGIEGALLWGVLMTLLSLLPIGSGVVWIPAAVILFIQGEIARALIIVAVGTLLIGLIDNLLRPMLVGRDTEMPDYLVLLATLGGITWFGLSGFIIGPVIAALFISCWEIVGREYGGKDL